VQVFDLDGKFVSEWTDLHDPNGLAIGPDQLVYVAEARRKTGHFSFRLGTIERDLPSRLSVFDQKGRLVARMGDVGRVGEVGVLSTPHGVAVDSAGNVYIAESAGAAYSAAIKRGENLAGCSSLPAVQNLFVRGFTQMFFATEHAK